MKNSKKLFLIIIMAIIFVIGIFLGINYSTQKNSTETVNVKVEANIEDADVYIGGEKIGRLKDSKLSIENKQVKEKASIYAIKKLEHGEIKSNQVKLSDLPDKKVVKLKFDVLSQQEQETSITNYFNQLVKDMKSKGNEWSTDSKIQDESQKVIVSSINRYANFLKNDEIKDIQFTVKKVGNTQLVDKNTYQADINVDIQLISEEKSENKRLSYDIPSFTFEVRNDTISVISFNAEKIKPLEQVAAAFLLQEQLIVKDDKKKLAESLGSEVYPKIFGKNEFHDLSEIKEAKNGELNFVFANKSEVSGKQVKVMFQGNKAILKDIGTTYAGGEVASLYDYDLITKSVKQIQDVYDINYIFSSSDLLRFVVAKTSGGSSYLYTQFNDDEDSQGLYSLPNSENGDKDILYRVRVSQVKEPTNLNQEVFWAYKNNKVYYAQNGYQEDWREYNWALIEKKKNSLKETDVYGTWESGDKVLHLQPESMSYGIQNTGVGIGGEVVSTSFDDRTKTLTVHTHSPATPKNPKEYNDVLTIGLSVSNSGETSLIYKDQTFYKKN